MKHWTLSLSFTSPSLGQEFEPSLTASHRKRTKPYHLPPRLMSAHTDPRKLLLLRAASCEALWAGWGSTGHVSYQWHTCWRGHYNSSANTNVIAHLHKWLLTRWPFRLQFSTKLHFLCKLIWKVANSAITQYHYMSQGSGKFSKGTTFIMLVNDISSSLARWVKRCLFAFDPLLPWLPNLVIPPEIYTSSWTRRLWLLPSGWTTAL